MKQSEPHASMQAAKPASPPQDGGNERGNSAGGHRPRRAARLLLRSGLLAAALAITGCANLNLPGAADSAASANPADPAEARRELEAGIALYDKGEYVHAIRSLLTAKEIWRAPLEIQVTAQKHVAFSHCLLNRPQPCRQSFSDLLRLKPDFELQAAEAGHPLWGAAFSQAKREASAAAARGPLAQSQR